MTARVVRRTACVVAFAAAAAAGCGRDEPDPRTATGTLEYTEADLASLTPGRVLRVSRAEGDSVRRGDTIVTLTQASIAAEVAGTRAQLDAATAQLRDLEAGARRTELGRIEAELAAAQAEVDRTAREVTRLTPLVDQAISRQQFDAAQTAARMAAARRDALQQSLATARAGARPEQVAAARAQVQRARAALDGVRRTESELVLVSPIDGIVISRQIEGGEVVAPGVPLVTIADTRRPYVRVYVGQSVLPTIRIGTVATATLDEFPDRSHTGRVAAVSTRAEFTPRVALTRDERRDLLFGVRVEFDDPTGMLKAGLPITVRFPPPR
jgi:HlyD family secretion protein